MYHKTFFVQICISQLWTIIAPSHLALLLYLYFRLKCPRCDRPDVRSWFMLLFFTREFSTKRVQIQTDFKICFSVKSKSNPISITHTVLHHDVCRDIVFNAMFTVYLFIYFLKPKSDCGSPFKAAGCHQCWVIA